MLDTLASKLQEVVYLNLKCGSDEEANSVEEANSEEVANSEDEANSQFSDDTGCDYDSDENSIDDHLIKSLNIGLVIRDGYHWGLLNLQNNRAVKSPYEGVSFKSVRRKFLQMSNLVRWSIRETPKASENGWFNWIFGVTRASTEWTLARDKDSLLGIVYDLNKKDRWGLEIENFE